MRLLTAGSLVRAQQGEPNKSIAIHPRHKRKAHCYAFVLTKVWDIMSQLSHKRKHRFLCFSVDLAAAGKQHSTKPNLGIARLWFCSCFLFASGPVPTSLFIRWRGWPNCYRLCFYLTSAPYHWAAKARAVGPFSLLGAPSSTG